MPPLVGPSFPKALLTVSNRPMLFYSLFALYQAGITNVTVIVESQFEDIFSSYMRDDFPTDPAVVTLSRPPLSVTIHSRSPDAGTADALRQVPVVSHDAIVLSSDSIFDTSLEEALAFHRQTRSVCTVALAPCSVPSTATPAGGKGKQGKSGVKSSKSSSSAPKFQPDHFAVMANSRLLTFLHPADLNTSTTTIAPHLTRRYKTMTLRSNLRDPHVYIFHTRALFQVLDHCPAISSVKYDAVPYMARRQHTLSRVADRNGWSLPCDEFIVSAMELATTQYAIRANTVSNFLTANFDVARGRIAAWLSGVAKKDEMPTAPSGKKDKKSDKKSNPSLVFMETGERVSVSGDSAVGSQCTAGDRTSVKKSVIGDSCKLGTNVKLNSCVLLPNVCVEDGANLANCVVCDGATVGAGCILKDCRVAREALVVEGTEASDEDFGQQGYGNNLAFDDVLGESIEFC